MRDVGQSVEWVERGPDSAVLAVALVPRDTHHEILMPRPDDGAGRTGRRVTVQIRGRSRGGRSGSEGARWAIAIAAAGARRPPTAADAASAVCRSGPVKLCNAQL